MEKTTRRVSAESRTQVSPPVTVCGRHPLAVGAYVPTAPAVVDADES